MRFGCICKLVKVDGKIKWINVSSFGIMNIKKTDDDTEGVVYIPTGFGHEKILLKPEEGEKKGDTLFLYIVVITASFLVFEKGCCVVWTSPVIPQLKSNDSDINPLGERITTGQISVLVGLPTFCRIFGPLLFGRLPDVIGRKYTLMGTSLGILLASLAMALGSHLYVYYIGRSTIKLCFGVLLGVLPIYMNEICEDHNRAKYGCLMMFFMPLGSLYGYVVGPLTSVRWFTFLCGAPLIPQLIFFSLLVPESPYYTAAKGDKTTTIQILRKLRSNKCKQEIEQDYMKIEKMLLMREKAVGGSFKKIFETRASRMGLLIGLVLGLSPHLSGVPVMMAFLAPVFNEARTYLSGNSVAILVGLGKLLFFFVPITIVGRVGKKPLLLISCLGTAVPLAVLSVYFYLSGIYKNFAQSIKWLPIVSILVYVSSYSVGLGSSALSTMSELFPNDLRSTATSLIMTITGIFMGIESSSFPLLSEYFGVYFCIASYSVGCFLCLIFFYFMLPETNGKSFQEIQELLSKKNGPENNTSDR